MIAATKSEFRKLFTIRSTYITFGFALVMVVFFAFYVEGIKAGATVSDPNKLAGEITNAISNVSVFAALIGVLLVAHEYRYNTIMYTLTSSRSRTQVLLAKIIAISVFAVIFCLIFAAMSPALAYLGIHMKGLHLVHQVLPVKSLLWRALFASWGFCMLGLVIAVIIRNQVGALVALFIIPGPVEALLGLLLKKNTVYLPFTSLNSLLIKRPDLLQISNRKAAMVASGYIVVGLIVAWQLFLRRDAN